jgi:hypothetical protein
MVGTMLVLQLLPSRSRQLAMLPFLEKTASERTTLPSGITLTAKLMANELQRQNRNNECVKESLQHIQLVA